VAIVVLTMHESGAIVRRVLDAGALGYFLKSDLASCLVRAIKYVSKERRFLSPRVSEIVLERFLTTDDPLYNRRPRKSVSVRAKSKSLGRLQREKRIKRPWVVPGIYRQDCRDPPSENHAKARCTFSRRTNSIRGSQRHSGRRRYLTRLHNHRFFVGQFLWTAAQEECRGRYFSVTRHLSARAARTVSLASEFLRLELSTSV
jgi:hypothetical protein